MNFVRVTSFAVVLVALYLCDQVFFRGYWSAQAASAGVSFASRSYSRGRADLKCRTELWVGARGLSSAFLPCLRSDLMTRWRGLGGVIGAYSPWCWSRSAWEQRESQAAE